MDLHHSIGEILDRPQQQANTLRRRAFVAHAAVGALFGIGSSRSALASSEARVIPPFAGNSPASTGAAETAVLAGGCFWGVQGVYQHVTGVANAVSGYAGGEQKTAKYELIGSGMTGHAEAVHVTYDPKQVSFADLLQVFFSVVHDPTQLNRQGPDLGTQYRSAVFPVSESQAQIAKAYMAQLTQARVFVAPIVTKIEMGKVFYRAEDYHQDFLVRNPRNGYIVANDLPKIEDLKRVLPKHYRAKPALVGSQAKPA